MSKVTIKKNGKKIHNPFSFLTKDDVVDLYISEHITANLGNYESAKISIGLTVPVKVGLINTAKKEVFEYLDEALNDKLSEIEE